MIKVLGRYREFAASGVGLQKRRYISEADHFPRITEQRLNRSQMKACNSPTICEARISVRSYFLKTSQIYHNLCIQNPVRRPRRVPCIPTIIIPASLSIRKVDLYRKEIRLR